MMQIEELAECLRTSYDWSDPPAKNNNKTHTHTTQNNWEHSLPRSEAVHLLQEG
jgi:hypothetical protein